MFFKFNCMFRNIALLIALLLFPVIFLIFWVADGTSPWDMFPVWIKAAIIASIILAMIQTYRIAILHSKGKLR